MDSNLITISPLGPSDREKAVGYVRRYYAHDGIEFLPTAEAGIAQLLSTSDLGRFFEIRRGTSGVGYIVMTFAFDHEVGGRMAGITDFYLVEEARGAGAGSRVMDLIAEESRALGIKAIELSVLRHNPRGRAFYLRNGFSALDERTTMLKLL